MVEPKGDLDEPKGLENSVGQVNPSKESEMEKPSAGSVETTTPRTEPVADTPKEVVITQPACSKPASSPAAMPPPPVPHKPLVLKGFGEIKGGGPGPRDLVKKRIEELQLLVWFGPVVCGLCVFKRSNS